MSIDPEKLSKFFDTRMDELVGGGEDEQLLSECGAIVVPHDYVLLEAISFTEAYSRFNKGLDGSTNRPDVRHALAYRIRAIGPGAQEPGFQADPGDYAIHISSAGDPLHPNAKKTSFILVRAKDICCVLERDKVEQLADGVAPGVRVSRESE